MKHRITLEIETAHPTWAFNVAVSTVRSMGTRVTHTSLSEISGEPVKVRLLLSKFREDEDIRVLGAWLDSEAQGKDFWESVEELKKGDGSMFSHSMITIVTDGFDRAFPDVPEEPGEVV